MWFAGGPSHARGVLSCATSALPCPALHNNAAQQGDGRRASKGWERGAPGRMPDGGSYSNPLSDEKDEKNQGGGGGDGAGSSKTPVRQSLTHVFPLLRRSPARPAEDWPRCVASLLALCIADDRRRGSRLCPRRHRLGRGFQRRR